MSTASVSPNSFQTFGDLLKYLRRREQLTQLELSIAVGYSDAQITRLEKNQRRPDLTALKALFIPALNIENQPELVARFLELAKSVRQEDAPAPGIAPYKGLLFFDESDADLFFGREALTARLAEHVMDLDMDSSSRFLAVVGASGSGKSSLVRAGLAVALKRAGWAVRIFTPGTNPLKALEMQLSSDQAQDASDLILILVDQFEETFTLCRNESERVSFIEKLLGLAQEQSRKFAIVIALRADFYSHCAQYPLLRQAVAREQEYIGQMTFEELRRAIEEPAKHSGWEFEPGLVDILLHDIGAHGSQEPEPGALPLLSHALLATWEHRRGRMFTLEGYRASGGVRGAIAETAESVFTDQLNQTQQELARDVFLRLTELGEGTEDTRRRAALNELVRQSTEAPQLRAVLNTLAEARLITLNEDSAEVAHEALIREWQRLHEWLTQDREGLLLHRHLTESAQDWEARGHDPSELYRGARLAQAREWASANEGRLNAPERAFISASIEQEEHDALEREAQRQRELEAAQKLAETQRRAAGQLRKRALYLTAAFIIALVMAIAAIFFGRQAQITSRHATSRELAAASLANLEIDPERSILLALQAVNTTYAVDHTVLPEAEDALHRAVQASRVQFTLRGHTAGLIGLAYSPDGTRLATIADDNSLKIWDTTTGMALLSISTGALTPNVYRFPSFSPDGKRVAAGVSNLVKVWDVASGKELLALSGHTDEVKTVIFSPDGKRIATASWDGTAKVWDAVTGHELLTLSGQNEPVNDVAFSPDGAYLATAGGGFQPSEDSAAMIWDAVSGQPVFTLSVPGGVGAVAFSPDGKTLATGAGDSTWSLWDVSTGQKLFTAFGHTGNINSISFDRSGTRIATANEDGIAKIWDASTGRELLTLQGHTSGVVGAAFSPDGVHVATAGRDNIAKIWDISPTGGGEWLNLVGHTAPVLSVAYSPDGKYIATASIDFTAKIWDAKTGEVLHTLVSAGEGSLHFAPDSARLFTVSSADFENQSLSTAAIWDVATGEQLLAIDGRFSGDAALSPDGKSLANTILGGAIKIWDTTTGGEIRTLIGGQSTYQPLAYSPDGKYLAAASYDEGMVRIWDGGTGQLVKTLNIGAQIISIVYSHNGKLIALANQDATVRVWDVTASVQLFSLIGHTGFTYGVAFSPDDQYLASSSSDGTAKIWNAADNFTSQPLTLYGHTNALFGIAFSPDGARFVTASRDGTARVYAFKIEDLVALAKQRITRSLTKAECQQYLHVATCPDEP